MQKRGVLLTIFALLFVLLAISDFSKPFSHDPGIGFVCLGVRSSSRFLKWKPLPHRRAVFRSSFPAPLR